MIPQSSKAKTAAAFLILCTTALLAAGEAVSAQKRAYRCFDADGNTVVTDSPPPESASYGCDIIDPETGRVIDRIEPQKSPAEYQAEMARLKALEDCEKALRNLRYRYASVSDIELARANYLAAIDARLLVIKAELTRARRDLNDNYRRAAESERSGRSVSRQISANIARLETTINNLEMEAEQKTADRAAAVSRYASEIERYVDGTCDAAQAVPHDDPPIEHAAAFESPE